MKEKLTIFEWLTENFKVIIRNDQNFALKREFTFNYAKLLLLVVLFFCLSGFFSIYVYKSVETYFSDEARKDQYFKKKMFEINQKVDTLTLEIAKRDTFIKKLQQIVKD